MPDPILTGAQKSFLRGLGQTLDPRIKVGKEGITPAILAELNALLRAHELVKVRFTDGDRRERAARCEQMAKEGHCVLAGAVGHTALFYRQHPDESSRRITLG